MNAELRTAIFETWAAQKATAQAHRMALVAVLEMLTENPEEALKAVQGSRKYLDEAEAHLDKLYNVAFGEDTDAG